MSYSQSSLITGSFITALSGANGVATQSSGGFGRLYYSANTGSTWTQNIVLSSTTFTSISLSGTTAIAAGINPGTNTTVIRISSTGGSSWNTPTTDVGATASSIYLSLSGSNAVLAVDNSGTASVYYSTNSGVDWNVSSSINGLASSTINNISISGVKAIATIVSGGIVDLWYSSDSGINWTQGTNFGTVGFNSITISGNNAIIVGNQLTNGFYRYSTNGGISWNFPSGITTLNNPLKFVSLTGSFGLIGSITSLGVGQIYYSTDSGASWTVSDLSLSSASSFTGLATSSPYGLASINTATNGYVYYSGNSGANWSQKLNLAGVIVNDVEISGLNSISGTTAGVYYTSSSFCYEKNTLVTVVENEEEVYKKVSDLKVGDLVKTYKNGNKKVKLIRSFNYKPLHKDSDMHYLYKLKGHDVIVTGGHSLLVDKLSKQERLNNNRYDFDETIEDKKLLLACSSDKFEKIDDDLDYELWHFALESDDIHKHYGVYINDGILSESCSQAIILKML